MRIVSIRVDLLIDNSEIFFTTNVFISWLLFVFVFPLIEVWYIYIVIYWQIEIIIKRM